ncbi:hypothetical protein [Mesorhizobium australicum]|uniref:hypothetical protein n=1 Tax=Mesorhizobium australicum TaxID=536018 RepID=UPI00333D0A16
MDYLTLLVNLIGAIAWPVALVVVMLVFRKQLVKLAGRVRAVSGPAGISATFADELEKAREAVEQTSPSARQLERPALEISDPYLELAKAYPEAAIMNSYKELEAFLADAMGANSRVVSPTILMTVLYNKQEIPSELFDLFQRVRNARNLAVHSSARLTTGEAIEFRALVGSLIEAIRPLAAKLKQLADDIAPTIREATRSRRVRPKRATY